MKKLSFYAIIILFGACGFALLARLFFPEILPVLESMNISFYIILAVSITAILRNVIGLVTYGLFGPVIISLGLARIGNLYWGSLAFFGIISVGITTRFILEPLKLQITHRMALVVIAVTSAMGSLMFLGFNSGNAALTYTDFLPILVSAWIAERFVRDTYESGWKTSSKYLVYTVISALVSLFLISAPGIIEYFIHTPELWILPIIVNVLLGVKVRFRFSDLFRFRRFTGNNPGGGYSQVLTVNIRNRDFIEKYNPKSLFPTITKLGIKEKLQKQNIPVPKTLAVFERHMDVSSLEAMLNNFPSGNGFVVKPNNSFGGQGIMVIKRNSGQRLEKLDGILLSVHEIVENMYRVMDGEYSGRWLADSMFFEERVIAHPALAHLAYAGLPDIRVIVFQGIPIMAMTRLPTQKSKGKANLHQGAIGAGIDLVSGRITHAILAGKHTSITSHPDTGVELIGHQIPFWEEILMVSIRAQKATGLGYAGVDVVVDQDKGPLIMEVNKRPGLEIQNANEKPLLKRLRTVELFLPMSREVSVEDSLGIMRLLQAQDWELEEMNWRISKESAINSEHPLDKEIRVIQRFQLRNNDITKGEPL